MEKVITELERVTEFRGRLLNAGINIPEATEIRLSRTYVEFRLPNAFGSSIELYYSATTFMGKRELSINFGTTGSFSPKDKAPMFRTMVAAMLLENWEALTKVIEKNYETMIEE